MAIEAGHKLGPVEIGRCVSWGYDVFVRPLLNFALFVNVEMIPRSL